MDNIELKQIDAIVDLLVAGAAKSRLEKPICIFTGGHNGAGKTHFCQEMLLPGLSNAGYANRDMTAFHETLAELIHNKRLFEEYNTVEFAVAYAKGREEAGRWAFERITQDIPELRQIADSPIAFINPDLIAYCTSECRADKARQGDAFLISTHYYRALASLPELMKHLHSTKIDCVVDSTMSDKEAIQRAARAMDGYRIVGLLFHCDLPVAHARVAERAQRTKRTILPASVDGSWYKFDKNMHVLVSILRGAADDASVMVINTNDKDYVVENTSGRPPAIVEHVLGGRHGKYSESSRVM